MYKKILSLAIAFTLVGFSFSSHAQLNKEKKSKYFQNNSPEPEFNVEGFFTDNDSNDVDEKSSEDEYDVKVTTNEKEGKYKHEKRVINKQEEEEVIYTRPKPKERNDEIEPQKEKPKGYYTSYGTYVTYDESRSKYDRYYDESAPVKKENNYQEPAPAPKREVVRQQKPRKEKEIKMTNKENEYQTTVVKRRYTNLDVLADDLDLAKIQRPVFKGICTEAARDVDAIIVNKTLTNLEKNYQLKQCYILRDKRLREVLDTDQYKKFLRIKDADEYLILTHDLELKDGVNK